MTDSPEQLHRVFQDAFNRHDLESIVALYEPGAVLVNVNRPAQGASAIREQYRAALANHPSIDVQTLSVEVAEDLALLHGKWILLETAPDGRQVRREGRNTEPARMDYFLIHLTAPRALHPIQQETHKTTPTASRAAASSKGGAR